MVLHKLMVLHELMVLHKLMTMVTEVSLLWLRKRVVLHQPTVRATTLRGGR